MRTRALVGGIAVLLICVPATASSGTWTMHEFFPWRQGFAPAAAAVAGDGGPPAAVVVDRAAQVVRFSPNPLGGDPFELVPLPILPSGSTTAALALGFSRVPHAFVARDDGVTFEFGYATKGGETWATERAVLAGPSALGFGLYDAGSDAQGRPHALVNLRGVDAILSKGPGGWTLRALGAGLGFPQLAVSPSGSIHVCRVSAAGLVHGFGDPLGVWQEEIVVPSGPFQITTCAIAAFSSSDIRIAFDDPERMVAHAHKKAEGWDVTRLPTPFLGFTIPMLSTGYDAAGGSYVVVRSGVIGGVRLFGKAPSGDWLEETPPGLLTAHARADLVPGVARPFVWSHAGSLLIWSYT